MKQVLIKRGQAFVDNVPAPQVEAGTVLVHVDHSCISAGTELSGVRASAAPLWKRAVREPAKVRRVVEMVVTQGIGHTRNVLSGKLATGSPTGYSAAGTIIEVGTDVYDVQPGARVACAGAQAAHHAEYINVPRNLVVEIPEGLDFARASTVTLGAIALQGIRRAQPTLGETFVVLGLGLLGQLTAQMLRINGCHVVGVDLLRDRIARALSLGMDVGLHPDDGNDIEQVSRLTDSIGADGVIITAATPSDEVISTAFKMCRKKGRVVLVGDVGLNLNRTDFYQKELDFFISSSYGPGRYDNHYEEQGLDYPVAYVRWTENRNMGEYLRLLADGRLRIEPLIDAVYPLDQAETAYAALNTGEKRPLMVLLSYPKTDLPPARIIPNPTVQPFGQNQIKVAVIGAGSFAKGVHLPNLRRQADTYTLKTVISRTGHNAAAAAKQFGAADATTDYEQALNDTEIDLVVISTRHNLHATMTLQALRAGKHVLVEKPLALTQAELDEIEAFYQNAIGKVPILLTGFNRRFSPYARRVAELVSHRSNPLLINYRMNAGHILLDNWVHTQEGGGRNRGEACHIYDLFTYLTGSKVVAVQAQTVKPTTSYYSATDNFVATLTFEDGSLASLTYTALGSRDYPKEQMDIFVDGKVLSLNDYKSLTITGAKSAGLSSQIADKGHAEELRALARAIRGGGDWPIPLWQQIQATQIALQVEALIV